MSERTASPAAGFADLTALVRAARSLVVFTGAGISTESGIPDYRSPGGQWTQTSPPTLGEFRSGPAGQRRYWDYYREFFPVFLKARPNPGHLALGRLWAAGRLRGVVTQNIDGLHQAGGVDANAVWELHGNAFMSACLDC
ncbi:MAG: Sir2 family NAD-dependent protein deacetylase, partial [Pseudomonadota bacterium]